VTADLREVKPAAGERVQRPVVGVTVGPPGALAGMSASSGRYSIPSGSHSPNIRSEVVLVDVAESAALKRGDAALDEVREVDVHRVR